MMKRGKRGSVLPQGLGGAAALGGRVALGLTLSGCALGPGDLDTAWGVAEPTYVDDVAPIVEAHCTRCHSPATRLAGGVDLSEYRSVRSARVTSVCTAVGQGVVDEFADHLHTLGGTSDRPCQGSTVGSMPPGAQPRLSLDQQMTLARWVAQGAPEE